MNRTRFRIVLLCLVSMLFGGLFPLTANAAAASLVSTVASTPCAGTGAQTWRFGYRLYFVDSAGRTTDHSVIPGVTTQAQGFADAVATDSACALRASIDIYDMGTEPWTGSAGPLSFTPPTDNQAFRSVGNYDATFIRYPKQGPEEYSGIQGTEGGVDSTGAAVVYPFSAFPVDAAGRSYPGDEPEDPWRLLLMHEWMHQVVSFYLPAELGWPHNDVHGAIEHGYTSSTAGSGVIEPYFRDMLQGKVLENGQPKGLLPQDYLVEGTPAHAKRRFLSVQMRSDSKHYFHFVAPADFDGTLTLTAQEGWERPNTRPVLKTGQMSGPGAAWTLDDRGLPRQVTVCVSSAPTGTARYRPFSECFQPFIPRCVVPKLVGFRIARARQKLVYSSCRLGRVKHLHGTGAVRVRHQSVAPGRQINPRSVVRVVAGPSRPQSRAHP